MKVLVLNEHHPPSAVFRYGLDISSALGDNVTFLNVAYSRETWPKEYWKMCVFGPFGNPTLNYALRRLAYKSIPVIVRNFTSDGGIIHYASINVTPYGTARERSIVTVFDNPASLLGTGLYDEPANSFQERAIQWSHHRRLRHNIKIFREYTNVIAPTEYVKQSIMKFGFSKSTSVIHPAVSPQFNFIDDKESLRKKLGLPLDKILILSVSTMVKRKNLEVVQKAVESLGGDFKLVRLGAPLRNSIGFRNVDLGTVNEIYNACDLLLFPTLEEGFGYPVAEAFKTGLPVVTSDIDVMREVSGGAAILVDPHMVDMVADGLKKALANKSSLIQQGFRQAERFSFEVFMHKMSDYYEGVLNE